MTAKLMRTPGQSPMLPGAVRAGGIIYTSGVISGTVMTAMGDPAAPPVPIEIQAREALEVLLKAIAEAGGSPETVVKVEAFLAHPEDFEAWNSEYLKIWPAPGPGRTTLVVTFPAPGVLIELQAVAAAL